MFCNRSVILEDRSMFRAVVEEAAALAALALFIGMVAIWPQVIVAL
jgi:hypothetical protein